MKKIKGAILDTHEKRRALLKTIAQMEPWHPDLSQTKDAIQVFLEALANDPQMRQQDVYDARDVLLEMLRHFSGMDWFAALPPNGKKAIRAGFNLTYDSSRCVSHPEESAEVWAAVLAAITPKPGKNDARDKFIYDSMVKGKGNRWILNRVNKRWPDQIEFEQGISQAGYRYAERNQLPAPPQR